MVRQRSRQGFDLESTAPRVLVECPSHGSPDLIASALDREGFDVATCTGPERGHPCVLLEQGACALVDQADVVVNLLCGGDGDLIARTVAASRRPPGLVHEVNPATDRRDGHVGDGAVPVSSPVTRDRLVATIRSALEASVRDGPPWSVGV